MSGAFSLKALRAGSVKVLPVAPRSVPFDLDLGPDRSGATALVYSRCAQEPPPTRVGDTRQRVSYAGGRGCRIYRYSFEDRRERRVPRLAGADSEYLPSIWKDRLATFTARQLRRGRTSAPSLVVRPLDGRGGSRRLPVGSVGEPGRNDTSAAPVDLDLRARRLAFSWTGVPAAACAGTTDEREEGDVRRAELWTVTLGGRSRRLERVCEGATGPAITSATVTTRHIVAYRRFEAGAVLARFALGGAGRFFRLDAATLEVAVDAGNLFRLQQSPDPDNAGGVELRRMPAP